MALTRIQPPAIADVREPNFRNIIINGNMAVSQRGTSASSLTSTGYNTIDRWNMNIATGGTWTQSQSTDVPTGQGFATSLKMDCTTANSSLSAGSYFSLRQKFEGQNLQYLKKGTSSAESLTCSFWVKSNKTGTYCVLLYDNDNTRVISKTITISSADTWEQKEITFAGDTTGALGNDNAYSLGLEIILLAGTNYTSGTQATSWESYTAANIASDQTVNLADSTSNEWYITGVQLEAGSVATDFEVVPYGQNLERCQRYYIKISPKLNSVTGRGYQSSGAVIASRFQFPVFMRTEPTLGVAGTWAVQNLTGNPVASAFDESGFTLGATTSGAGDAYYYPDGADDYLTASAEL